VEAAVKAVMQGGVPGGTEATKVDELTELMCQCMRFFHHHGGGHGGQRRILQMLVDRGSIQQSDLQQLLQVQAGSMSEILAKMERRGVLERIKDETDRRKTVVRLTKAGEECAQSFCKERRRSEDVFAVLDAEQKEKLKELLRTLLASWTLSR